MRALNFKLRQFASSAGQDDLFDHPVSYLGKRKGLHKDGRVWPNSSAGTDPPSLHKKALALFLSDFIPQLFMVKYG
ncbi:MULTISPECIES: hypothetical protein [Metabacillus]|uniref:Uncharacterized protein n=1 Tax=Metabacillus hrfriensis TaxID=3048891 RepID=A0ACD4RE80_9BACI|nr:MULTISPECIES: hypothetical protein [Metabacillus]UAL53170.1 hypothetical protein K8L98_05050 [Metabacillus dongyingensis]UOK58726.1 hypothetical protein MGI18_06250 [Bacillus sp. OVS6]USK29494.1 hypothetical protein LIT32_05080 [Bacillus sp. CMF21]WHZ58722.1 hypothetical protein QLQ22_05090 [Metabacillus sp. CT-WN-B3]